MTRAAIGVVGRSDLDSVFRRRDVQVFRRIVSSTAAANADLCGAAPLAAPVAVQLGLPAFAQPVVTILRRACASRLRHASSAIYT